MNDITKDTFTFFENLWDTQKNIIEAVEEAERERNHAHAVDNQF